MKKVLQVASMLFVVYGLSVTAAMSQTAPQCAPGCACTDRSSSTSPLPDAPGAGSSTGDGVIVYNPETEEIDHIAMPPDTGQSPNSSGTNGGILGASDRHRDVVAVRNSAYNRQISKQNDESPTMTCFDRAIGLTSRLGTMFSDKAPEWDVPAANTEIFGGVNYPDLGFRITLGERLRDVVTDGLIASSPNFMDSLAYGLSDGPIDAISTWVFEGLDQLIELLMAPIEQLNEIIADFNNYVADIYRYFEMFNLVFPVAIQELVMAINALWAAIQNYIDSAISVVMNVINNLIANIQSYINSAVTSVLEHISPDGECARLAKLWGNGFPENFRGLIGTGIERGAPYVTLLSTVYRSVQSGEDPGKYFLEELANGSNSTILRRAMEDIADDVMGTLSGPGTQRNSHYWPALPTEGVIGYRTVNVRELVNCIRARGQNC